MSYPDDKEIQRAKKKLENVEPVRILPEGASQVDRLKFELCKQFVIYLRVKGITQAQLANKIGLDPARVSEIVKYKIDLFTVDRLLSYVEKLNPDIKVTVA